MHWELCHLKEINTKPPDVMSFFVTCNLKFETSLKHHKLVIFLKEEICLPGVSGRAIVPCHAFDLRQALVVREASEVDEAMILEVELLVWGYEHQKGYVFFKTSEIPNNHLGCKDVKNPS